MIRTMKPPTALDLSLGRSVGMLGFIQALGEGDSLSLSEFLSVNTFGLARLFPGLAEKDIEVGFFSKPAHAEEMLVGTSEDPIFLENQPVSPHKPMVLLYNGARLDRFPDSRRGAEMTHEQLARRLAMLWGSGGKMIRSWFIRHRQLEDSALIPSGHMITLGYPGLFMAIEGRFLEPSCRWTPRRLRQEYDAALVGHYLASLMFKRYMDGGKVPLREIYGLLFKAWSGNCAELMPAL